jgi:moderate conductance mechanosensitive channel
MGTAELDRLIHEWLLQWLPAGPITQGLALALRFGLVVLAALVLFFLLRWIALRGLVGMLRSLQARAPEGLIGQAARLRTLEGLGRSLITYVLLVLLILTLLAQAGVEIGALLAGAGVLGLAVSFGSQRLVRDLLSGAFLLMEDQFRTEEVVTLIGVPGGPIHGRIEEIGLRITRLKDTSGRIITLSNGDIVGVVNHSRYPISASIEISVSPAVSLEQVDEVVREIDLPGELFTGGAQLRGVTGLDAARMCLNISAPAQPGRGPEGELALRRRVGEALRAAEIEIK